MTEYFDPSAFEPLTAPFTHSQETPLPPPSESPTELAATSYESGANAPLLIWQPTEPQFTKQIAEYYGVSRKSVQQWFLKVKEACPWFTDADLKLPDGRYTPLCIELMGDYRTAGLPFDAWKARIWQQNPDLVTAYQTAIKSPPPEPQNPAGITVRPSDAIIPVQEVQPLHLTVIDSTQQLTAAIAQLNSTLQQFVTNDQTLESALKQTATQKGSRLGTELAIAEIGSMVQATDSMRVELAKKMGLLNSTEPPEQQSA